MKQKIICMMLSLVLLIAMSVLGVSANAEDEFLLACAIEATAGGESYTVMASVGSVLLNRIKSRSYPQSLAAVISDAKIDISNVLPSTRAIRAARDAMGEFDPTDGALEYTKIPENGLPSTISVDGWSFY